MSGASVTASPDQPTASGEEPLVLVRRTEEGYAAALYTQTDETEIIKKYAPMVKVAGGSPAWSLALNRPA